MYGMILLVLTLIELRFEYSYFSCFRRWNQENWIFAIQPSVNWGSFLRRSRHRAAQMSGPGITPGDPAPACCRIRADFSSGL
nr:MAG TPA: hypothetical protein [Bacteriophage sp.]